MRGGAEKPSPEELSQSNDEQAQIFKEAMDIYRERNAKYGDAWRRSGWRGTLTDLRRKIERAWSFLWSAEPHDKVEITQMGSSEPEYADGDPVDVDDLFDIINYAAFSIRAVREGNRDGYGGWW